MWTAAILGGGQARRLGGRDKSALIVGGHRIIDRQLAVLGELDVPVVLIGPDTDRPGVDGLPVMADRMPAHGALGGLYTALVAAPFEHVVVLACDMPFVTASFLAHLAAVPDDVDVVVPCTERGRHPLCARYHRRVAARLKPRLDAGRLRVFDALDELTVRELGPRELRPFDPDGTLLMNVNTPDDYHRACALADGAANTHRPLA